MGTFGWKIGADLRHIVAKIAFLCVPAAVVRGDMPVYQGVLIFAHLRAKDDERENNRFSMLKKQPRSGAGRRRAGLRKKDDAARYVGGKLYLCRIFLSTLTLKTLLP